MPRPRLLPVALGAGVTAGFTTRAGGGSRPPYDELNLGEHVGDDAGAVRANRQALACSLGVPRLVIGTQVHGADVHVVEGEPGSGSPSCDALVTAAPGVALAVLVADCVPVLLADVRAGVVAVAHAGRQGLVAGVVQRAVAAMGQLGADPADTRAVVGPAIGGCCYEVPPELQEAVAAEVPDVAGHTSWGTPSLDLPAGVSAVLRAAGIRAVQRWDACTAEDGRFYSYRRDGTTGRFAGVVLRA